MTSVRVTGDSFGKNLLERTNRDAGINAGCQIRVGISPGLSGLKGQELGNDQTAGKACGAGVCGVNGGKRPTENHATFGVQGFQSRQMGWAGGKAGCQTVGDVFADDGIKHYFDSSGMYLASTKPWATMKTNISAVRP